MVRRNNTTMILKHMAVFRFPHRKFGWIWSWFSGPFCGWELVAKLNITCFILWNVFQRRASWQCPVGSSGQFSWEKSKVFVMDTHFSWLAVWAQGLTDTRYPTMMFLLRIFAVCHVSLPGCCNANADPDARETTLRVPRPALECLCEHGWKP